MCIRDRLKKFQYESDKQCVMATLQQNGVNCGTVDLEQEIATYARHRQQRIENFLGHVKAKHREQLEQVCPAL